jgi:transmembrane sensor
VALVAGRSLTASGRGWQLGTVDLDNVRGWTTGELTFRNAPLADVVRETNRYSPRKIVLRDPDVGRERLSAVLKAGDIDTLVSAVQDLGIAHASSRDAGSITLSRR